MGKFLCAAAIVGYLFFVYSIMNAYETQYGVHPIPFCVTLQWDLGEYCTHR